MPITTINGELYLEGDVGSGYGDPEYFTAREVAQALGSFVRKRAKVRLNSGGGSAWEGQAIAAAFRAHPPGVEVAVEGIAASAATIAACGASRCTIAYGSLYMIHEASMLVIGGADLHRQTAAELDLLNANVANSYSSKTGKPVSEMRSLMKAETWMTAEDSVARGFCDAVVGAPGAHPTMAAFDYRKYRHPPAALKARAEAARRLIDEAKAAREAWAAIADLCVVAGRPGLAATLINAGISVAEASRRIDAEKARAVSRDNMLKRNGLTRAQVDKMRADRGMSPVRW